MVRALLACLGLLYASLAAAQADPVFASRSEYQGAVKAYEAHDYPAFLLHAKRAQELRPSHGGVTYALASAYALTGDDARAVETLRHFAALGYVADISADSDLAPLRGLPGYAKVRRELESNRKPMVRSIVAFTLPERDLLTEGIAYDPGSRAFFVGSVHHRKIVRIASDGRQTDFVAPGADSLWAPLGMKVDPRRSVLWVASAGVPQMEGFAPGDVGRSGLFRFDAASGKLTGRFIIRDNQQHTLGDLTIASNGDVYSSDSRAPLVWRVRAGIDTLERFLESPLLLSAQGLALTPDEHALYLADYSRGILRIDLATRRVALLPARPGVLALGIDGLYLAGGKLIGIQNGVEPHRVVRLTLDARGDSLVGSEVLERLHPRYSEPTLGVIVGSDLYYVANSQWERFGETGTVAEPDQLQPPTILRLRL
ncbi:MAG: SMP-30/gluconolactonase/LRE family protein [Gemmatimonadales bacterium]